MTRHGDSLTPRLGLHHDSGWASLSHDTGVRPDSSGETPMYGSHDIYGHAHDQDFDDVEDFGPTFGEIGDAVGDEMFGRRGGRPRRRAAGRAKRRPDIVVSLDCSYGSTLDFTFGGFGPFR